MKKILLPTFIKRTVVNYMREYYQTVLYVEITLMLVKQALTKFTFILVHHLRLNQYMAKRMFISQVDMLDHSHMMCTRAHNLYNDRVYIACLVDLQPIRNSHVYSYKNRTMILLINVRGV